MTVSGPSLPPLYFGEQQCLPVERTAASPSAIFENTAEKDVCAVNNQSRQTDDFDVFNNVMPAEVVHQCLVAYANWGDLAKLACVQRRWKNLLSDSAAQDTAAAWSLAQALLQGTSGLQANPTLAIQYLLKLSNIGFDDEKRIPLEERSVNNDVDSPAPFSPAMREIANCFLTGTGVTQDSEKGLAWLKASHLQGKDNDAAYELAQIYEHGYHETPIDVYAAFAWFAKAAEGGHVEAMNELALCYELGCGVEQNDQKALDWYMRAACLGHATAKYSVGEAYEEARGVPQSDEEACIWYYKAALDGDEDSRQALVRLIDIARIVCPGVGQLLNG
ncbi:hypothetical protein ACA910_000155 [Epithemia clementina (nom. ined.)]